MPKPIISIITNNMGNIIVIRSPLSRKWLFNLSISKELTMKKALFPIILLSLLFIACENPVTAPAYNQSDIAMVSTKYVRDNVSKKSCWFQWASEPAYRDSLIVEGKRYTISERSRYRVASLPKAYLTELLAAPGYFNGDWAIYRDTKSDSIYIFTDCESLKNFQGDY